MEWFSFVSSMFSFISSLSVFLFAPLFVPFFLFVWVLLSVQDLFFFVDVVSWSFCFFSHFNRNVNLVVLSAALCTLPCGCCGILRDFWRILEGLKGSLSIGEFNEYIFLKLWVVWDSFWDSFVYFCGILVDSWGILRDPFLLSSWTSKFIAVLGCLGSILGFFCLFLWDSGGLLKDPEGFSEILVYWRVQ